MMIFVCECLLQSSLKSNWKQKVELQTKVTIVLAFHFFKLPILYWSIAY